MSFHLNELTEEEKLRREEERLERALAKGGAKVPQTSKWVAQHFSKKKLELPPDTNSGPPVQTTAPITSPKPKQRPPRAPRTRGAVPNGPPPHPRTTVVDPSEDPSTYADMSIFELRPFKVVDGNDTTSLMQNFAYMLDQPIHPETAERAESILAKAQDTKLKPSPEANEQLKGWRMLGSATMKSSTQAKQAAKNWEETDQYVSERALDPSFKAAPEELMALMDDINAKLLPGIMVKEGDHEVPAKPGMRLGEQAAAGMDTGGDDLNPTRMYIPGSEVEKAMKDMCAWLSSELAKDDVNPIELAARAYQEVVTIHPFHDANGRSARFVMDFVLQKKGMLPAALGEDVNLCCFPRIDPDHQPSPTGALNVVMRGIERSYDQVANKKKPAGPLPSLSEDVKTLLAEMVTNKALLATYDVPVDTVISQFNAADSFINEVKAGEWPGKEAEAKARLKTLTKTIGNLPVLRKELGKLTESVSARVDKFDEDAAAADFRGKAPTTAKEWSEADPGPLAILLKTDNRKVVSIQNALLACLAVKPVAKLEDVGVPFDKDFDRWSQQVDQQITKPLGDAIGLLNPVIATGLPKYAADALGDIAKTFEADLKNRKELVGKEIKDLYQKLALKAGVDLSGPSVEEQKLEKLGAIRIVTDYLETQNSGPRAWGTDATELLGLCEILKAAVESDQADKAQAPAEDLKGRIDKLGPMRLSNLKRSGGLALLKLFELE